MLATCPALLIYLDLMTLIDLARTKHHGSLNMQLPPFSCSSLQFRYGYGRLIHAPSDCLIVRISDNLRRTQGNRPNYDDSRTLKRGSRNSSAGIVTRLGPELHGVRFEVQSMDNLFSKTSRLAVFKWLFPGG